MFDINSQPGTDLDLARLAPWLAANVKGFDRLVAIEKFPGGQSNPTYRVQGAQRSYVLRRKPFGTLLPSAHAIEREYKVLARLHGEGFPVPAVQAICEDHEVIGAPFYVMELADGRTFWDGDLPDLDAGERAGIYQSMIDTLARLHMCSPDAVGLSDFGPPGNYFERQARRWTKQYRAAQTENIDSMERLIEWLPRTLPPQDRVSIIHGDYRIDNLIFAPDRPTTIAVIDWELSTLGDPIADFAYLALNWVMPTESGRACLGGIDLAPLGIPDLDTLTHLYCTRTNRAALPDLNWYFAYNLFRAAGIGQGVLSRIQQGNASSAQSDTTASKIISLADQAWEYARRAGARA